MARKTFDHSQSVYDFVPNVVVGIRRLCSSIRPLKPMREMMFWPLITAITPAPIEEIMNIE